MEKDEEELYKEEPSSPDVDTPLARKNFTWLEKLLYLKPFLFLILEEIRDSLSGKFLVSHPSFVLSYFPEAYKTSAKYSSKEFISRFIDAIVCEGEDHDALTMSSATSFITSHMTLYKAFEDYFDALTPQDTNGVGVIGPMQSERLLQPIVREHGHLYPYLFAVLLGIALDQDVFRNLKEKAMSEFHSFDMDAVSRETVTVDLSTPSKHAPDNIADTHTPSLMLASSVAAQSLERFHLRSPASSTWGARSVPSLSFTDPLEKRKPRVNKAPISARDTQAKLLKPKVQQGYLLKRAHDPKKRNTNKALVSRWVVIKDAAIFYFRDRDSLELLGKIPLYLVSSARKTPKYGTRTFSISTVGRTFHFQAETEAEVNDWLFAIQREVAYNLEEILSHDLNEERKVLEGKEKWWKKSLEHLTLEEADHRLPDQLRQSNGALLTEVYAMKENGRATVSFTCVVNSEQGHRSSMEDAHLVVPSVAEKFGLPEAIDCAFFSVFDGHGGIEAARFAKCNLLQNIIYSEEFSESFEEAIRKGCAKTDHDFVEWALQNNVYSGTTVIAAILQERTLRTLTVINIGDSRAVLSRNGVALPLSVDHKPDRPDEKERIEKAGGLVQRGRELNMMKLHRINPRLVEEMNIPQRLAESVGYIDVHRVMGELALSRSIGDGEYKGALKQEFWQREFSDDLVIAEPDIVTTELGEDDDFLLLACDGLWDVMDNQAAVDFVSAEYLRASSAEKIARRLVKEALRLGSQDNITLVIVFFKE